jgi:signal peptidase I
MSTAIPVAPVTAVEASARPARRLRRAARARLGAAACVVAVAAIAGSLVYLGSWPPLAVVESGSMTPTINTGDVVVLKRLDRAPRVGDVVAVDVPEEARSRYGYPSVVVHRVVRIAPNGDLTTKGDARRAPDPFTVRHVSERVLLTIPAAGRALGFLTSTLGLVWLGLGAVLLLGLPMLDRRREAEAVERGSIAQLHDELRSLSDQLALMREDAVAGGGLHEELRSLSDELARMHDDAAARGRLHDSIHALARDAQANRERLDELVSAPASQPRSEWDRVARVLATLERPAFTPANATVEYALRTALARPDHSGGDQPPLECGSADELDFAPPPAGG